MRDARGVGQGVDSQRPVAIDLAAVEHGVATGDETVMVVGVVDFLLVLGSADALPEDDGGRAFALANLGTERLPLAVGSPDAAGVTARLCCDPESERIDAAVGLAGGDIGGPGNRSAPVVPGHVLLPGTGFDGGDDLGGDAAVDIGTSFCGHGRDSCRRRGLSP